MTEQIVTSLLQTYGSLGLVLVVAGYALRALQAQLTAVQEKRIADAQAFTAKVLELVESQHEYQMLLAKALDGNVDAIHGLRMMLESLLAERGYNRVPSPPVPSRRGG